MDVPTTINAILDTDITEESKTTVSKSMCDVLVFRFD